MAPRRARTMDFTTLGKLSTDYPASDQRPRYGDMLWTCRLHDGSVVLIVIEFQSEVDHTMPLRLFQYTGSAWLEWVRSKRLGRGDRVPLVVPVLVYSGRHPWTPPTKLEDILPAAGPVWLATQPRYGYLLLEERRGGTAGLPDGNLVTELVAVTRARERAAVIRAVSSLRDRMGEDEGSPLDRAVAEWVKVVLSDLDAGLAAELAAATTTREVLEVIKPTGKWAVRWYEDGVDDGIERGIERERALVRRLAVRRFGSGIADRVVPVLSRLTDAERIAAVAEAVLDCDTADEFIVQARGA